MIFVVEGAEYESTILWQVIVEETRTAKGMPMPIIYEWSLTIFFQGPWMLVLGMGLAKSN